MESIGDKIFEYKRPVLERRVERFLAERPFIPKTPPVEVDLIQLLMPEVRQLRPIEVLAAKYKVSAMVLTPSFMHRDLVIAMDQGIMNSRNAAEYNMTIAEEIGHIELHRAVMLGIHELEDFIDLQKHSRWAIAERDAKYFARALLMPRRMLERVASEEYKRLARDIAFSDAYQFESLLMVRLSTVFDIPLIETRRRIEEYTGGMRTRLDKSIAICSEELLDLTDEITVRRMNQTELPFADSVWE